MISVQEFSSPAGPDREMCIGEFNHGEREGERDAGVHGEEPDPDLMYLVILRIETETKREIENEVA